MCICLFEQKAKRCMELPNMFKPYKDLPEGYSNELISQLVNLTT